MSAAEFQGRVLPSGAPPGSYFEGKSAMLGDFVADMQRAVRRVDGYVRDNLSWCGSWDIDLSAVSRRVLLIYGAGDQMVPLAHGEWLHARLQQSQLKVCPGGQGHATFGLATHACAYLAQGQL
jgi:pimeloyl-ACP methyl ester carboxylesterase